MVELTQRLYDDQKIDVTNLVFGSVASVFTFLLLGAASRIAQKRVTFVDDYEVDEESDYVDWPVDEAQSQQSVSNALLGLIAATTIVVAARLLMRRR